CTRRKPPNTLYPYTTLFRSDRVPTELVHADLEADARARRGLLEDHAERLADERLMELIGGALVLELAGVAHERANLVGAKIPQRSEEHTSELQSLAYLVCRI